MVVAASTRRCFAEAQSPTASIAAGSGAEAAEVEAGPFLRAEPPFAFLSSGRFHSAPVHTISPGKKRRAAEPQSSERARLHGGFVVCKGQSTEPPNQPPQFHMYSRSEGARGPGSGGLMGPIFPI